MLADLARPAKAPSDGTTPGIHLSTPNIDLGIGDVSLDQRIGFESFDPAALEMHGYHAISVCIPAFGCIANQTQPFVARLVNSTASGACPVDYSFTSASELQVTLDDTEHTFTFRIPPFQIPTPAGPVSVAPHLGYEANLKSVHAPFAQNNASTEQSSRCGTATLQDVLNPAAGTQASIAAGAVNQRSGGWDAVLGMGTRSADLGASVWTPDTPPHRPDDDQTVARSVIEKLPVSRFNAGVNVTYGLDQLLAFLALPPFELRHAEVFVKIDANAAFASQFQIQTTEAHYTMAPDCHGGGPRSGVVLRSGADAWAGIAVTVGVNIEFVLELGFFDVTLRFNPQATPFNPNSGSHFVAGPVASATSEVAPTSTTPPSYSSFEPFSGTVLDGDAFVQSCLSQTPPPQAPPPVSFTPGNPADLLRVLEFPCNICMFLPAEISRACVPLLNAPADTDCGNSFNGLKPCTNPLCHEVDVVPPVRPNLQTVEMPASQATLPANERWVCNSTQKTGCFDTCRYDPARAEPLQVIRSAVTVQGAFCRDASGEGDGTPHGRSCHSNADCEDGNSCTQDICSGASEFRTCHYTPLDGTACDDGAFCNGPDTCALGLCTLHAGNPCTGTQCCNEQSNACQASCSSNPCDGKQAGDSCDDGSACTNNERCAQTAFGLMCGGSAALRCPETGNPCTTSQCVDVQGTAQCQTVSTGTCPPTCGNSALDIGEECDGNATAECSAGCDNATCRCLPERRKCGNGVVDPHEECDGAADAACRGRCRANCHCPAPPRCGNSKLEAGEECDGHADKACSGRCDKASCRCRPPTQCECAEKTDRACSKRCERDCKNDKRCKSPRDKHPPERACEPDKSDDPPEGDDP
jgi:hypothetical protein